MVAHLARLIVLAGVSFAAGFIALAAATGEPNETITRAQFDALSLAYAQQAEFATFSAEQSLDGTFGTSTQVEHQKGESRRTDQLDSFSDDIDITIERGERRYTCSVEAQECIDWSVFDQASCEPGWCIRLETEGVVSSVMVVQEPAPSGLVRVTHSNFAGEPARCYEDLFGNELTKICYSHDGIPLYLYARFAGGYIESRVTKLSREVDDSVFELPYPLVDLRRR